MNQFDLGLTRCLTSPSLVVVWEDGRYNRIITMPFHYFFEMPFFVMHKNVQDTITTLKKRLSKEEME